MIQVQVQFIDKVSIVLVVQTVQVLESKSLRKMVEVPQVQFVDRVVVVLVVSQREVPTIQKVLRLIEVFQKTSSGQGG